MVCFEVYILVENGVPTNENNIYFMNPSPMIYGEVGNWMETIMSSGLAKKILYL